MSKKIYTPSTWVSDKVRNRFAALAATLLLAPAAAWAQAPANDDCAGATTLTVGATCTTTAGTSVGATQSRAPIACAGFTSAAANDVWFKFVATNTAHNITVASGIDGVLEGFGGSCTTLTSMGCADDATSNSSETLSMTGLTVGSTYYFRYYGYQISATTPVTGTLTACVTSPAAAPANDNCAGAVSLTPGATCTATAGTVTGATQSQAAIACAGFTSPTALDVWYKFVATGTAHTITFAGGFDGVMEVFSGACGTLSSLACGDASVSAGETLTLNSLTVGNTYFVRYYPYGSTPTTTPNFTVCVRTVPANDASVDAIYTLGKTPVGAPVTVQAVIRNAGSASIPAGLPVSLAVSGATTFSNAQATTAAIPVGGTTMVTFTSFTPAAVGNNTLTVSLLGDDVNTNNTLTYAQVVNSNILSYANATTPDPQLSVGFGATATAAFITRFNNDVPRNLTAVNVGIEGGTNAVGNTVYGVLVSSTGALLARTPNTVLTAADISTRKTFTFATPQLIAAGNFYVGMVQTPAVGARYYPLATLPQSPTMAATFYTISPFNATTGGTLADAAASNLGIFVIEAVADRVTGTSAALNRAISMYPNPSNGLVTLDVRGANAQAGLEVQVLNSLGQVVHKATVRDNFENKLNLSNLAAGVYTLKVKAGDEYMVRQLSLTK